MEKQIVIDGTTYVFRFPTARDIIQIDLKGLQLRQGVTDGLNLGYSFSQGIALCEQLCTAPQGIKFDELRMDILSQLNDEVTKWINSFRDGMGDKQGEVGEG